MRYLLILLAVLSPSAFASVTCGSGASAAALELSVGHLFLKVSNGDTLIDNSSVLISTKWNWASTSHPATDWHVDNTYDSTTTSTGWKTDVQNFQSSSISWGYGFGTPALSVGSHTVSAKLITANGVNCTETLSFNIEPGKIVGAASVNSSGLISGGACIAGVNTGKKEYTLTSRSIKLRAGGALLGTATINLSSPASPVASTCGTSSTFTLQLTDKQKTDFCGQSITGSMEFKGGELSFTGGKIPACPATVIRTGKLQHFSGLCLSYVGPNPGYDAPLLLQACSSSPYFEMLSDGNIKLYQTAFCLHPRGGSFTPANSTPWVLWPACNEPQLAFQFNEISGTSTALSSNYGIFRHTSSGQCIHPLGGATEPAVDTPVVFWGGCEGDKLKYRWLTPSWQLPVM